MKLTVNGKETSLDTDKISIRSFLDDKYPQNYHLAIELNGRIIDDADYKKTLLNNGDCIEVLLFMGGG